MRLGLFYGSTTGNTEHVAHMIKSALGEDIAFMRNIVESTPADFEQFDGLILGASTWFGGQLQDDWESFLPQLDKVDLSGKKVALFGLGDQATHGEEFVSGLKKLYNKVRERGAHVIGLWPIEGYDYEESEAAVNGHFVGLALDEDTQSDLTEGRVQQWVEQLRREW